MPYKQASKVAEVTLFSDQGVNLALQIVLCYWPNDSTRILVHGSRYFVNNSFFIQVS